MPDAHLTHQAAIVFKRLDALAVCSDVPGEITRLFLSPAHKRAIALVQGWMEEAGLATSVDDLGTLKGIRPGPLPDSPILLLGSHIDTVRNAGRYDGCLGVVAAIALAQHLQDTGTELPYALEIRAFGDEEGVRFPVTLTGAHATAGHFNPAWLNATDAEGHTFSEALANFGLNPTTLCAISCRANRAFAYLELHIEQGPILEAAGAPLGIVTAINGAERHTTIVTGQAGHAGTVPMNQRQDALAAAAEMILAIRREALARPNVVATVGRLLVEPGAPNVIPARVSFSLDLRAPEDAMRHAASDAILQALQEIADTAHVDVKTECTHQAPATPCDTTLQAHLERAISQLGLPVLQLPSGAGHDAMAIAALCPIGMLFLRCKGGISHHPDEAITQPDIAAALEVLLSVMLQISPGDFDKERQAVLF